MINQHHTSIISNKAELGSNVTIGPYCIINENVKIWCYDNQLIDKIPFKLQLIKTTPRSKTWISEQDFNLICSVSDPVYVAYFTIAYNTGLRLRELNTNPKDKAYKGLYHTISRQDNLWQLKVYGKQGKEGLVILDDDLNFKRVLQRFLPLAMYPFGLKGCKKINFLINAPFGRFSLAMYPSDHFFLKALFLRAIRRGAAACGGVRPSRVYG